MTERMTGRGPLPAVSPLRTPRAAAVAGIIFSVLLIFALVLLRGVIAGARPSGPPAADTFLLDRHVTTILLTVYSMRMAAVFTLTTVTIARHTQIVSRWLTIAGLVIALVLLATAGTVAWVELLFPAWILALSLDILIRGPSASAASRVSAE
jgi:hypothetical protein